MNPGGCVNLSLSSHTGVWFRAIQPQFWTTALATHHTASIPGRFNEGRFNTSRPFEILYLAENPMVALFEVQSLLGSPTQPGGVIANPRQAWIVINVSVHLQRVADLTDVAQQTTIDTNAQELTGDWRGYQQRSPITSVPAPAGIAAPTQELGAAIFTQTDAEGFYSISAKLPYSRNLAVFPQKLRLPSQVVFHHPYTGQTHTIP